MDKREWPYELEVCFSAGNIEVLYQVDEYLDRVIGPGGRVWIDHVMAEHYPEGVHANSTIYGFQHERHRNMAELWCTMNDVETIRRNQSCVISENRI